MSLKRLHSELKELTKEPNNLFSVGPCEDNFYKWNIIMIGAPDTIFDGAIIKAYIEFSKDYPNKAPSFIFITPLFHPNIYSDGKVCISILHEGIDETGYENISERWNPSHSVNSIIMSIILILITPNLDSIANVDNYKLIRDNYTEYKEK